MNLRTIKALFVAALATTLASSALAAPTFYSTRAALLSALGSTVTDNYANPSYGFINSNAAMSAVLGETDYRSTGWTDLNIVTGGTYCAGCNGSFELTFTTTSVGDANGVYGMGMDVLNNTGYYALITYGDNSTDNVLVTGNFFGLTSATEVKSIHFGLSNGGATTGGSFQIDNLTIGGQGNRVPEPGSLALASLALVGLSALSRKRRIK